MTATHGARGGFGIAQPRSTTATAIGSLSLSLIPLHNLCPRDGGRVRGSPLGSSSLRATSVGRRERVPAAAPASAVMQARSWRGNHGHSSCHRRRGAGTGVRWCGRRFTGHRRTGHHSRGHQVLRGAGRRRGTRGVDGLGQRDVVRMVERCRRHVAGTAPRQRMRVLAVQRSERIAASDPRAGAGHVQGGLAGQQRIRVLLDEIGSAGRHAEQVWRGRA